MTPPRSDAPTAAEVIEATLQDPDVDFVDLAPAILYSLVAAFPHLVFDVTDPEQLKQAGFVKTSPLWGGGNWAERLWLAPDREAET